MIWKNEIFNILENQSGQPMTLKEIYEKMRQSPVVTEEHLKSWQEKGQPRYECWIRRYLTDLVREGKIKRVCRGVYLHK